MTVTTYQEWVAAGKPWHPAPVIAEFAALLRRYGYTVDVIGDQAHLTASPPEDHTPYSHTPWPGSQPYPLVLAMDVLPGGPIDWRALGAQIVADRDAGIPGSEWIKYVNWTDHNGRCWHTSWEPGSSTTSSSDTGHIHISARTDRCQQTTLSGWDPVAHLTAAGGTPTPTIPQEDFVFSNWTDVTHGATGHGALVVEGLLLSAGLPVGCDPTHLDGIIGTVCDASIRDFQARHGLKVDGIVGRHTLSMLLYGRDLG